MAMIVYVGESHQIAEPLAEEVRRLDSDLNLVHLVGPVGYEQAIRYANDPDWQCPLVVAETWHDQGLLADVVAQLPAGKFLGVGTHASAPDLAKVDFPEVPFPGDDIQALAREVVERAHRR